LRDDGTNGIAKRKLESARNAAQRLPSQWNIPLTHGVLCRRPAASSCLTRACVASDP
jgi:hypothetical protein